MLLGIIFHQPVQQSCLLLVYLIRMEKLRKYISILALLLIPVYFLVLGSSVKNRHTHVLSNGVVITHSHPFTDSNGKPIQHGHTRNQIVFFHLFTFDFFDSSPTVFLAEETAVLQGEIKPCVCNTFPQTVSAVTFLRGPPVLIA
jgi:hypothetical protein